MCIRDRLYKALEQMHNDQLNQLSLETADGSESKPVQKKQPKNNFHNFPERDYTREQTKDLERILRGYAKAVSYTHLDVYKRQVQCLLSKRK